MMHQRQRLQPSRTAVRRIIGASMIALVLATIAVSLSMDEIRRALCALYSEGDPMWYLYACYLP